ncbi:MAG: hypothetical protein EOO44_04165 [Flavobacterium sp.]|uniref:glycosyltransferase family 25 protein n=1 Tax=Pedobacter agri TaxID=454586 RepID=UPI0011FEB5B4|nr:glycosyltransferase family 25 protein [Pedobacter agri]MDQ1141887.1 GR25 family glycosyltransferase involved in LPS biosynthesis [Pedobacter agri]RZJ54673.1 MAG: hypothetical protein EOO44_04165 [Flavobacterium sp.]
MKSKLPYTNLFDAIYCINLPESTDRYQKFIKTYQNFSHKNLIIFAAVNGNTLMVKDWPGNSGELGCRQSHINVLKDAQAKNYNTFMVVEDDVIFPKNIGKKLDGFLKDVGSDWDMLYLYMENSHLQPKKIKSNVYQLQNTLGMVAIIYNKRCISQVIEKIEGDLRWVDSSIADLHLVLKAYGPKKTMIKHRNGYSTIAKKNIRYRTTLIEKLFQRFMNLCHKTCLLLFNKNNSSK